MNNTTYKEIDSEHGISQRYDILQCKSYSVHLFADDTFIYFLLSALNQIQKWSQTLTLRKIIGNFTHLYRFQGIWRNIIVSGDQIKVDEKVKYLGITIDYRSNFRDYANYVMKTKYLKILSTFKQWMDMVLWYLAKCR